MSGILIAPPESEPLSLAEAKAFLRIDHSDEDGLIASLIAAARARIESETRCAMIAQTWCFIRDSWPDDGRIALKRGPVLSIEAVRVFNMDGVATPLDSESFVLDRAANTIASPVWALPSPGRPIAGIEIEAVLGFGAGEPDVPDSLRHAVRLLVAHWYEHRGLDRETSGARMPAEIGAIVAPYRVLAL